MKKIMACLFVLLLIGAAAGAGGGYWYYGRWVNYQHANVPVQEPITVITIEDSIPEFVYPGDEFTLIYQITNNNPDKAYEMTSAFSGNWEVIRQCQILVTDTLETPIFRQTFTANDSVEMDFQRDTKEKLSASETTTYNSYCQVFYTIPAGATCQIEAKVIVRNDSPTEETASSWYFSYWMDTFRGRDETPYYYTDDGAKG